MKLVLFICILLIGFSEPAHERWLVPSKFVLSKGEGVSFHLMEGDNFMGKPLDLLQLPVEKVELHHLAKVKDITTRLTNSDSLYIIPDEEGIHALTMETSAEQREWEGEDFNAYLKDNGLNDIFNTHERSNALDAKARELCHRYAKALIRVGSKSDETFSQKGIFPIEIIPVSDPYQYKVGEYVAYKILFQGKPLFGAKVKVWNFYKKRYSEQNIYPEMDGTMEAHISNPGRYMLSVMQMVPSKDPRADWQTYWGTLVFSVQ